MQHPVIRYIYICSQYSRLVALRQLKWGPGHGVLQHPQLLQPLHRNVNFLHINVSYIHLLTLFFMLYLPCMLTIRMCMVTILLEYVAFLNIKFLHNLAHFLLCWHYVGAYAYIAIAVLCIIFASIRCCLYKRRVEIRFRKE